MWWVKLSVCVGSFLLYGVQSVYYTHMLQLNSYRPERYRRWVGENRPTVPFARKYFPALLLIAAAFLAETDIGLSAASAVIAVSAWFYRPKKAKKPLVVTARVKRLFVAELLVGLLPAAIGWWLPTWILCLLYVIPVTMTWATVSFSAMLTEPIERSIARGYTEDARRILASCPDLTVIGITGSYGKTSTKTFLHALLSTKYNVLMTPASYNTPMGVVRTVREQLRMPCEIFLVEMGAKNPGDIAELCELVHPRYGVLTSIGEQHLETFGSLDNIIHTKFELVQALPSDGQAFLNGDNEHILSYRNEVSVPSVLYGTAAGCDYTATDIAVGLNGCSFTVTVPSGESMRFTTHLLGRHNIQNLTGCIAVAHTMGIPLKDLSYAVRQLKPVPHRLELLPNGIIDDAYNSNPAGFRSALEVLADFPVQRVLVTPGMVELGERQEALNRELGAFAASRCDVAVLVGQKQAPPLKEGLLSAGFAEDRLYVADDFQAAMAYVRSLPSEPRIVLLENDLPDNF